MEHSRHTFQVGRFEVSLHTTRKACEHFAFSGAFVDFLSTVFRVDMFMVVLFAKFCLLAGAIGVYLVHREEQSRDQKEDQQERVSASQGA